MNVKIKATREEIGDLLNQLPGFFDLAEDTLNEVDLQIKAVNVYIDILFEEIEKRECFLTQLVLGNIK